MAGYVKIYRSLKDNWIWRDEERFNKRDAFIDLIFRCNHRCIRVPIGNKLVLVKRGQFISSNLKLAEAWKWDERKVRRFMELLKTDRMVNIFPTNKYTVYEVSNYADHQAIDIKDVELVHCRTNAEQTPNKRRTNAEQTPTNNNVNKENNEKKVKKKDNTFVQDFEKLWSMYPNKVGRGKVNVKKLEDILKQHGLDKIGRCVERYKADKPDWKEWQNGSTFFNSGYIDYLTDDYKTTPKVEAKQSHNNFDQREYEDGELDKYYVDVTKED